MRWLLTAASLTFLLLPGAAGAEEEEPEVVELGGEAAEQQDAPQQSLRVILLEVEFSESFQGPLQERLTQRLVTALRRQELDVVEPETVSAALRPMGPSLSESCRGGRCVGWILEVLDGDAGMMVTVDGFESSYSVTLSLFGPYGEIVGRVERRCDICTFDELAESVAVAGRQAASQIPRRIRAGRIGVFPTPEDAEIEVDGVVMGRGAMSLPVPEGTHLVEARARGYRRQREEVNVEANTSLRLELALVEGRDFGESIPDDVPSVISPWLWAAMIVGLAASAAGGALTGLGQRIDDDSSVTIAGVGVLSAGLTLAFSSGVSLLILTLHDD